MLIRHCLKFSQPTLANNLTPAALVSFLQSTPSSSSQGKFSTKRKNISASVKQKTSTEEKIVPESQADAFTAEVKVEQAEVLQPDVKKTKEVKMETRSQQKKAEGSQKKEKVEEKIEKSELQEKEFEEEAYEKADPLKWHRKWGYRFLRVLKYAFWLNLGYFAYHMVMLKYYKQPKLEMVGTNMTYFTYAMKVFNFYYFLTTIFTRPPVNKLLPDKPRPPPGYQGQKTLVLNLNGTLVHSEYKLGIGFELLKRPGLATFLQRASRFYEIIIFADEDQFMVNDVIDAIDPMHQMILIGFGRESTVLQNGEYIKDLKYLNRRLQEVIMVETRLDKVKHQPENTIVLPRFDGNPDDNKLFDLIPLLEHLGKPIVRDVRQELKMLGSENPVQKFREVSMAKRQRIEQKGVGSFLGKLTGKK